MYVNDVPIIWIVNVSTVGKIIRSPGKVDLLYNNIII